MVLKIPRKQYVELYGPTKGDRIRLGDTDLVIEIEKDFITYGDELVLEEARVSEMVWDRPVE